MIDLFAGVEIKSLFPALAFFSLVCLACYVPKFFAKRRTTGDDGEKKKKKSKGGKKSNLKVS